MATVAKLYLMANNDWNRLQLSKHLDLCVRDRKSCGCIEPPFSKYAKLVVDWIFRLEINIEQTLQRLLNLTLGYPFSEPPNPEPA